MILVDSSQIVFAAFFATEELKGSKQVSKDMFRHIVLNMLRSYKKKFGAEYGEMVLCYDAKNNWRKQIFPYYKAKRSIDREADNTIDWSAVFETFSELREEFDEYLPYKGICVDTCEGDDVIAALVHMQVAKNNDTMFGEPEKTLIISSDGDFKQLHNPTVQQWNPILGKPVKEPNPLGYLMEKILRGDKGDGVPNILSADDIFLREGGRQTPLSAKKLDTMIRTVNALPTIDTTSMTDVMLEKYKRNDAMINLFKIPGAIQDQIVKKFEETVPANKMKLYNYMIKFRMTKLLDTITEF